MLFPLDVDGKTYRKFELADPTSIATDIYRHARFVWYLSLGLGHYAPILLNYFFFLKPFNKRLLCIMLNISVNWPSSEFSSLHISIFLNCAQRNMISLWYVLWQTLCKIFVLVTERSTIIKPYAVRIACWCNLPFSHAQIHMSQTLPCQNASRVDVHLKLVWIIHLIFLHATQFSLTMARQIPISKSIHLHNIRRN